MRLDLVSPSSILETLLLMTDIPLSDLYYSLLRSMVTLVMDCVLSHSD